MHMQDMRKARSLAMVGPSKTDLIDGIEGARRGYAEDGVFDQQPPLRRRSMAPGQDLDLTDR
jgi:hypothetical protein